MDPRSGVRRRHQGNGDRARASGQRVAHAPDECFPFRVRDGPRVAGGAGGGVPSGGGGVSGGDGVLENGGLPIGNCDLPIWNCGVPIGNCDLPIGN